MRTSTIVRALVAGGAVLVFGVIAFGAAMAVPDTPPPAYVAHYAEDLELLPPPAASAQILSEATGATVPSTPPTSATSTPPTSAESEPDDTADDRSGSSGHGGRDDDGHDSSGPGSGGSGSGSGRDHPEDG